ncbi:twin-arginine translocation signal domain-containing protein [Alteromonas macleodii]
MVSRRSFIKAGAALGLTSAVNSTKLHNTHFDLHASFLHFTQLHQPIVAC